MQLLFDLSHQLCFAHEPSCLAVAAAKKEATYNTVMQSVLQTTLNIYAALSGCGQKVMEDPFQQCVCSDQALHEVLSPLGHNALHDLDSWYVPSGACHIQPCSGDGHGANDYLVWAGD